MINEHIELLYLKGMSKEALIAHIRRDNCAAFVRACYNGHLEVVKLLLKQGFVEEQIKGWNCYSFRHACRKGYLEIVKLVLEQGFVEEQIKGLRRFENSYYKLKYKDLVELNIL